MNTSIKGLGMRFLNIKSAAFVILTTFLAPFMAGAQLSAPYASTMPAVPGTAGTLLRGIVMPNGGNANCWFEWGVVGGSVTNTTTAQPAGASNPFIYVTDTIAKPVAPSIQYWCRLVAMSKSGAIAYGAEQRFGSTTVTAWGAGGVEGYGGVFYNYGQSLVPDALTNVVAVVGGNVHSLVLREDGTVAAWGAGDTNHTGSTFGDDGGQSIVPAALTNAATANVIALAAGYLHNLALRADGTVVAWGASSMTTVKSDAGTAARQRHSTNV